MTLAEALDRVERNADLSWMAEAYLRVVECAIEHDTFTTDEVWAKGLPEVREPRALGVILRRAVRHGVIMPTGEYRKTSRPQAHERPMAVWRSTLRGKVIPCE